MIKTAWDQCFATGPTDVVFKQKLKIIKARIKEWRSLNNNRVGRKMEGAKDLFLSLEKLAEERDLTSEERAQWQSAKVEFLKERRITTRDLKQKARIRWRLKVTRTASSFTPL